MSTVNTPSNKANYTPNQNFNEYLQSIGKNSNWILAKGILGIVAGVAAIMVPVFATFLIVSFIAMLFIGLGAFNFVSAFSAAKGHRSVHFVLSVIQLGLGALMLLNPIANILALTVMLAVVILIEGLLRMALAFEIRPSRGWGWVLTGGIITLFISVLIISQLPTAALWVIGTLAGIHFIFSGMSDISLSFLVKDFYNAVKQES